MIFHIDFSGVASSALTEATNLVYSLPWNRRIPLLSAASVSLILSAEKTTDSRLQLLAVIHNQSNIPFYLYRNRVAMNPIHFVSLWYTAKSTLEALQLLSAPAFDPRAQAVLEMTSLHASFQDCLRPANITLPASKMNTETALVESSCSGLLVFSQPFDPGWKVDVDGQPAPVHRANHLYSAVFLTAGRHRVVRYYRPSSLLIGGITSLHSFCWSSFLPTGA